MKPANGKTREREVSAGKKGEISTDMKNKGKAEMVDEHNSSSVSKNGEVFSHFPSHLIYPSILRTYR